MTTTETTDRQTLAQFIIAHAVTMTAEPCDSNPNMDQDGRDNMDHWRIVLRVGRRQMTTYFSMGYGHNGAEPDAAELLSCLADDAASADESFEDFCSNLGFDTDSRKAERTYKAIKKNAAKLRRLLYTDEAYEALLYKTERD